MTNVERERPYIMIVLCHEKCLHLFVFWLIAFNFKHDYMSSTIISYIIMYLYQRVCFLYQILLLYYFKKLHLQYRHI